MTKLNPLKGLLGGAALALSLPIAAQAADFTFNLQSFLPAQATIPSKIIDVWADDVEEASGGRIEIKRFASMQLGGKPPELIDQVIDGQIDITWNVVGYTPGRFPSTEVFELPFLVTDARAASSAFWQMMQTHMEEDRIQGRQNSGRLGARTGCDPFLETGDDTGRHERDENPRRLAPGQRAC